MSKWRLQLFATILMATTSIANANIINGDFQTCDLTGWNTDSATLGSPGYDTDFNVVDLGAGNCAAEIGIDLFTTQEFIANTLFTDLDLTVADGFGLNLSFDYIFGGEEQGVQFGRDNWFAALGDGSGDYFDENGNLGTLFSSEEYGAGTVNLDLTSALNNLSGWTLEFQLVAGFDVNFLGSLLTIDNVQLTTFQLPGQAIPEPSALLLMFAGLAGLFVRRRK